MDGHRGDSKAPGTKPTSRTNTDLTGDVSTQQQSAVKPHGLSRNLSSTALIATASSRKSSYVEPSTTASIVERAVYSMPRSPTRPFAKTRTSSSYSNRQASNASDIWTEASMDTALSDDNEHSRTTSTIMAPLSTHGTVLDQTLRPRDSLQDPEGKRMSTSSIYSLNSARAGGMLSSAPSLNGSEAGYRSASGSAVSPIRVSHMEAATPANYLASEIPHTTLGSSSALHQGNPRESAATTASESRRTTGKDDHMSRINVPRSRSRVKRRFSGSTVASSHSPSSERGTHSSKNRDEVKPAPYGTIGVCALDVKARSKPSRNILNRIISKGEFEVVVFGDKVILDEEIENWPVCDYLISFYSEGFPLSKAITYVKARRPFCVNDLPMQMILWDRRICLRILDTINVPTPRRVEVSRDGGPSVSTADLARHLKETTGVVLDGPADGTGGTVIAPKQVELLEDGDLLSVDGVLLRKPFVEKPTSGEDHNICIYYPRSQGGGARKLFRKIGNKSSEWVEGLVIPRALSEPGSSYLYEEFMSVDNFEDVKAYTVGPDFCHAETRKSPVVDGLVRRNTHGKEVRYITSLTRDEAAMASRIATSFGQRVCGFDLLRAGGQSYVIDVNGWSFVKDNEEYYDQCASILKKMFIDERKRRDALDQPGALTMPMILAATTGTSTRSDVEYDHRSISRSQLSRPPSASNLNNIHSKASRLAPETPEMSTTTTYVSSPPMIGKPADIESPSTQQVFPIGLASTFGSMSSTVPATANVPNSDPGPTLPPPALKHAWKLKGVVSVIRHADRTPKQKYKFTFHTKPFIELLKGHQEEVLLTGQAALESVINAVDVAFQECVEDQDKLRTLRNVLVKKGGWVGTKVQIKPMFRKRKNADLPIDGVPLIADIPVDPTKAMPGTRSSKNAHPAENSDVDGADLRRSDSISEVTLSRITAAEERLVLDKLQLIVKWGGEPTHSARYQSQELGENMRNDFFLMNKEIFDEVRVFSSSERRVTTSAQIWAASFLSETDLPSDFITIRKDLLDDSNAAKDEMDKVKKKLKVLLREGHEPPPQFAWPANLREPSVVQRDVIKLMNFHRRVMRHNFTKLTEAVSDTPKSSMDQVERETGKKSSIPTASVLPSSAGSTIQARWCCGEDAELFRERWEKLFSEFCDGDKVDPSKISELYDTMKFDALHNRQFLEWAFTPSKTLLEEESAATKDSSGVLEAADFSADTSKSDKTEVPSESSKSVSRRLFRRRSGTITPKPTVDDSSSKLMEQYFRLYTGSNQTKAKTDARLEKLRNLYRLVKVLFDFICPQEYGITNDEKLEIGLLTSLPLLKEIVQDLEEMQASDEAKSFFYFTKESHIYTLLNCIIEGGIETKIKRSAIPELDYLSQICFELYESETTDTSKTVEKGKNVLPTFEYSIRISISPGCHTFDPLDVQLDSKHCISCAPRRSLTSHQDWKKVIETLRAKFHTVKLPKSFLAVNLSESHTFHKKEDSCGQSSVNEMEATGELTAHDVTREEVSQK